jgi:hypothetical protein
MTFYKTFRHGAKSYDIINQMLAYAFPNRYNLVVVDPPRWTTYAIYNRRKMFNYLVGTPESIFETSGKIAKLLNTRYVLVHYRNVVKLEQYIPIHLVEFKWFARYLNTENKNTSLYVLYERKNTK